LVAGAFGQRIPLTMPVESGTDGVPIFRGVPGESGAQPLGDQLDQQRRQPGQLLRQRHRMQLMTAS
jgi:hypothetical protein